MLVLRLQVRLMEQLLFSSRAIRNLEPNKLTTWHQVHPGKRRHKQCTIRDLIRPIILEHPLTNNNLIALKSRQALFAVASASRRYGNEKLN